VPVYATLPSADDRVARELRAALNRHKREIVVARHRRSRRFRNELKGTLTALMLSCELALQATDRLRPREGTAGFMSGVGDAGQLGIAGDEAGFEDGELTLRYMQSAIPAGLSLFVILSRHFRAGLSHSVASRLAYFLCLAAYSPLLYRITGLSL